MGMFDEIRFDMSRDGLIELSAILEPTFSGLSDELQNFANVVRNLVARVPPMVREESSWLDE